MKKIIKLLTFVLLIAFVFSVVSCGKKKAKDPCASGHTASEWIVVTEKSCETDGSEHKVCTVCGVEIDSRIIPAGHNYGSWIDEVPASYKADGVKGHYHCDGCQKDFDAEKAELSDLSITKLTNVITDVEITTLPSKTSGFYEELDVTTAELTVTWADETTEKVAVTAAMITTGLSKEGVNTVSGEYEGFGFDFDYTLVAHTVAEAKVLDVGTVTFVKGVVAGMTASGNAAELLIKDEGTNVYFGVRGGSEFGAKTAPTMPVGVVQGDLVAAVVTIGVSAVTDVKSFDYGKKFFDYNDAADLSTKVVAHDKEYKINYNGSDIIVLDNEQAFREFQIANALSADAEAVKSVNTCTYQVVKLTGMIRTANYGTKVDNVYDYSTLMYRLAIGDEVTMNYLKGSTEYSKMQYTDYSWNTTGSAVFREQYSSLNLSKPAGELVFGLTAENVANSFTWTNPGVFYGDLYFIYVGGNAYYANFTFTSDSDIVPDTAVSATVETVANPDIFINTGVNLEGQKVKVTYRTGRVVEFDVTAEMLDAYTLVAGENTITGKVEGVSFSFVVNASAITVSSVSVKTAPFTGSIFYEDFDVKDGLMEVTYSDSSKADIAMTEATFASVLAKTGAQTITGTYEGKEFTIDVTFKAHTVAEAKLLAGGVKTIVSGVYATVTATANNALLLIQDEGTNVFNGMLSATNEWGKANAPTLVTGLVQGDLITCPITIQISTGGVASADRGKKYFSFNELNAEKVYISIANFVEAHGKTWGVNKTGEGIVEITTQQQLRELIMVNALQGSVDDRYINPCTYQVVKFTNLRSAAYYSNYRRIHLGTEITGNFLKGGTEYEKMQYVDYQKNTTLSASINTTVDTTLGAGKTSVGLLFGDDWVTSPKTDYTAPRICEGDCYLIYIGGSNYYTTFILLSADDIVHPVE